MEEIAGGEHRASPIVLLMVASHGYSPGTKRTTRESGRYKVYVKVCLSNSIHIGRERSNKSMRLLLYTKKQQLCRE